MPDEEPPRTGPNPLPAYPRIAIDEKKPFIASVSAVSFPQSGNHVLVNGQPVGHAFVPVGRLRVMSRRLGHKADSTTRRHSDGIYSKECTTL
jgi:hypothetical protein